MENSPFDTNNPYKRTPKSQSTLPLEPRVPRAEQDADAPYMPKPPRPDDFNEIEPQHKETSIHDGGNPVAQDKAHTGASSRGTVNFMAQPGPRRYETPASYGQPSSIGVPQERPTQPPISGARPRPTVTYQPGQAPAQPAPPHTPRPYPTPTRSGQATTPAGHPDYHPTVPADTMHSGGNGPHKPVHRPTVVDSGDNKGNGNLGIIICVVIAALLVVGVGGGCWWYFGISRPSPSDDNGAISSVNYPDNATTEKTPEDIATGNALQSTSTPAGNTTPTETPGIGAGSESTSLFNRPLTYKGTVTPGGVASLNIILFQNGRLEGTIDYSSGRSMPLFGSYTWTDNGHMMNINFTVSSKKDKTYSESWMGHSSYIKDDLAHTLTFKRINTSNGQSMTASFALRP